MMMLRCASARVFRSPISLCSIKYTSGLRRFPLQTLGIRHHRYEYDEGNWTCTGCGFSNWGRRTMCKNCGDDKTINSELTTEESNKTNTKVRMGNWVCPVCKHHNRHGQKCAKCRNMRTKYRTVRRDIHDEHRKLYGAHWWCPDNTCRVYNAASAKSCINCGTRRANDHLCDVKDETTNKKKIFQDAANRFLDR